MLQRTYKEFHRLSVSPLYNLLGPVHLVQFLSAEPNGQGFYFRDTNQLGAAKKDAFFALIAKNVWLSTCLLTLHTS